MNWFTLSLVASLCLAAVLLLQKAVLNRKEVDPIAFAIYFQLLVVLISSPIALYLGTRVENFDAIWPLVLLMAVLYGLANTLLYWGMKHTEISRVSVIMTSVPLWVFLGGVLLLGESFNLLKVAGVALVVSGLFVLAWAGRGFRWTRASTAVLLASFLMSGAFLIDRDISGNFSSPFLYQAFSFSLPVIVMVLLRPNAVPKIPVLFARNIQRLTFLSAVVLVTMSASVLTAYRLGGEVSRVIPIVRASSILVVIFSYLFLGERKDLLKKLIAAILVVLGVVLLR